MTIDAGDAGQRPSSGDRAGSADSSADVAQPAAVTVRVAGDADEDVIVALWDQAGMLAYTSEPYDDLARTRSHDPDLVLVAEVAGRVVGTVTGTWDGRRGWIMRLAVDPAARRQRVASALVADVEARLRARGATRVNVLVFAENRDALAFWRERDYRSFAPVVLLTRQIDDVDG